MRAPNIRVAVRAADTFAKLCHKELQQVYIADADSNRALLDRRVIRDLLGFDKKAYEDVRRLAA